METAAAPAAAFCNSMDQDRRDAAAWAEEWRIRHKNRKIITVFAVIVFIVATVWGVSRISELMNRTIFSSEAEMREAMQGRFAIERWYEDIIIEGDEVTLTFLSLSHYDRDYAERNGYDYEEDSVYHDRVVEWDYRHGVIRTEWMSEMVVDKKGNIRRYGNTTYYRTDKPRPEPIDPVTLNNHGGNGGESAGDSAGISEESEKDIEAREESLEATQEAASAAGVVPDVIPDGGSGAKD